MEATTITRPESIARFRMLTLRAGLILETKGMRKRGESCFSIIKREFGLKGSKERVLEQFDAIIKDTPG